MDEEGPWTAFQSAPADDDGPWTAFQTEPRERLPLAPTEGGPGTQPPPPPQSFPAAMGNALTQGVVGGTGQALSGTGDAFQIAEKRATNRIAEAAKAVDEGAPVADVMRGLTQVERGLFAPYLRADPARRKQLRAGWGEIAGAGPNAVARAGEAASKYSDEFKVAPEQEGYMTGAARMAGAVIPAIGGAAAGALAAGPLGGILGAAATVYTQSFDAGKKEAEAKGATPEQAEAAAGRNAAIQTATMAVPITRLLQTVPGPLRDGFVKTLVHLGQSGVEFATANALGRFAQNWVMRETVDPNQSLTEGIADDAIMGGIAGVALPGVGVAGRGVARGARGVRDAMAPAAPAELRGLIDAGEALAGQVGPAPDAAPAGATPVPTPEAQALGTLSQIAGDQTIPEPPPLTMPPDAEIPTMRITPDVKAEPRATAPNRAELSSDQFGAPEPPPFEPPPIAPIAPVEAPPAPPRPPAKPPDALSFLISKGGVLDPGGDIAAMGGDAYHHRAAGRLVNNRDGLPLDQAREALRDAGYLPQDATINDVLDIVGDGLSGRPRFPADFEAEALSWRQGQDAYADHDRFTGHLNDVQATAHDAGIIFKGDEANHAAELMMEGVSAADAVAEAVRAGDLAVMQAYEAANGLLSARERSAATRAATGAPSPEAAQARQMLAAVMQAVMRRTGLPSSVGLKLVDRLVDAGGNPADAAFTRSLLTVALDTPPDQIMGKLFHEITHGLLDPAFGALTPNQRAALLKSADRWLAQPGRRAELEALGYDATQIREEAVARAAEEVLARAREPGSLARRGAEAMVRAVEAVGNGLRGQGFTSADGVFRAIMQGRVRGRGESDAAAPQYARRPPLPPKEGEDLFGATRPPPAQRAPEPTIRTDPRQETMPGMGPSAVQAQAARDRTGLVGRGDQRAADEGLFADRGEGQGGLFSRRRQGNLGLGAAYPSWEVSEPGTKDAFIRAIQDNKIDVKRLRDALKTRFNTLTDKTDTYLNEELYHGRVSERVKAMQEKRVVPMLEKIAKAAKSDGVTVDDVNAYLHARHAPERNAAMQKINPDLADNTALSGMSDADAAALMAEFDKNGKAPALADIANDVDALLNDTRKVIVREGLEAPDVVDAWEKAYQSYVPLQRDITGGTPKGQGVSVRGPEAKRAVGSNREVVNILANVVGQAETAVIRAEKAKVGRSLLAMAKEYPNPDFWRVDDPPTKARIDPNTGLVVRDAVDPLYQTADNVVMVKEDGEPHFVVFNKGNERAMQVAHALKNLDVAALPGLVQMVGKGTRFMASLLTQRNPLFWFTNMARDVQGAMLNMAGTDAAGQQAQFLATLPMAFDGMRSLVRGDATGQWAQYAKELRDAGGTTGFMQSFEDSTVRMKDLEKQVARMKQGKADPRRMARSVVKMIDDYNDIIENGVRLAAFQRARENGASTARAAALAKNITVNFNRKGNWTPFINSLFMFFNAGVQGTARLAQAVTTSRTAQAAVGGLAAAGMLLDIGNRMIAGDDEETGRNRYDLISEFEKSKNWIFMNPMRPGEYVKIPLPLGPHVFHNMGRLIGDAATRRDPRDVGEYAWMAASTLTDAFNPLGATASAGQLFTPSVADPIVQIAENKSFTGAPVYKSSDRGFGSIDPRPAYTRYFENTPEVWKGASRLLNSMTGGDKDKRGLVNIEPDIMKHVFYAMTGGLGRTLDQGVNVMQGKGRNDHTVNRLPFVSRFYGETDDRQRDQAYLVDRKRILQAKADFDYFRSVNRPELAQDVATRLGDGNPDRGFRLMDVFTRVEKGIRPVNREIQRQERRDAPPEEIEALRSRRHDFRASALQRAGSP